jgi:hypothetical protein
MKSPYETDYSPETELFSVNDTDSQVIIVIEREQLEALIKLYDQCIGLKEIKNGR